uniref:Uncharacterized protein n=1 Tax=Glossina austeni TaxID=7395 RepID=A0A1A9UFS7_GLOAU
MSMVWQTLNALNHSMKLCLPTIFNFVQNCLEDRHFNGERLRHFNWHILYYRIRHFFLDWDWYMLLYGIRYYAFDRFKPNILPIALMLVLEGTFRFYHTHTYLCSYYTYMHTYMRLLIVYAYGVRVPLATICSSFLCSFANVAVCGFFRLTIPQQHC